MTGKFRGAAHCNCNINLQLTRKAPVIFHSSRGYDSHLIFCELDKFDVKTSVIPNGLEKYMTFFLNKILVFINSMQFMKCSLDKLDRNLSDEDFKYLKEEDLELLTQKDAHPYEYINSFEIFNEEKLPAGKYSSTTLKRMEALVIMVKCQTVT